MDQDPLVDIAADLYALPPEDFVPARDDAVKRAKQAGDKRLATAVGKLRKPTVGAWAVNLLAHERPDLVDDLLELGEELRSAQRNLRGDDLRDLSLRRRKLISELARTAVSLARGIAPRVGPLAARGRRATLRRPLPCSTGSSIS